MILEDCVKKVCDCYEETEKILLELEEEINYLFVCDPDEVYITNEKITQYKQMADELMSAADEICTSDSSGLLIKASDPQSCRADVDDSTESVFIARQNINAVLFRIQNVIPQVEKRLQREKDKSIEKIRNNNTSQSANVSKYFSTIIGDNNNFSIKKSRSI